MTQAPHAPETTPTARPPSIREHWQKVYREKAEDQVSWFQPGPGPSLDQISRTGASPDARIVDVGGGASRLADALLDRGYRRVAVLDVAAEAFEHARARLGERAALVAWITGDVRTWASSRPVDVWHDRAAFHFMVRPEDREAYRATLLRTVRSGGHVIIATFASDGPERCSGLPVLRWEPAALTTELGPELRLVEGVHHDHLTPAGKVQRFQFSRFVRI